MISRTKAALLGATALVVAGGFLADFSQVPPTMSHALAQAPLTIPNNAPSVGPASFADIVDRVRGAVVSVKVTIANASDDEEARPGRPGSRGFGGGGESEDQLEKFFRRFGGENSPFPKRQQQRQGQAQGSGFFISADGYVVTNNHVVEKASEVSITIDGGKTVSAKVIGTDPKTDLALLKVNEPGTYPFVEFSNGEPRIGDWVLAVGNPFGLGGTVTAGIVSARGRDIGSGPYDDYLQIDAPVNRGNSGGPAFDTRGQVVGVNTAIFSPSGGSVGIGFAIPAEVAKNVIASLRDKGSVARGYIGVQIQPVTQDIADSLGLRSTTGALVAEAKDTSPAGQAGIKAGDVILAVNGAKVESPRELARRIAALGPEKAADITYSRQGSEKTVKVKLGELPADQQTARGPAQKAEPDTLANLGLQLAPAEQVPGAGKQGVAVSRVDPEGAAAQKGLRVGDVILEAAGQAVTRPSDISSALASAKKDGRKAVLLRVKSAEGTKFVALATAG